MACEMDNDVNSYERFLQGDTGGLEELVERHNTNLILFIHSFISDLTVCEDLAADTFLELILKKHKFIPRFKFKTWLFKIARNNAVDYLRKHNKHKSVPLEDIDDKLTASYTPEEILLKSERDKQLHRVISTLHSQYKQILHLIYFEDMSYEQAGKVLKKNGKQIKNLVYRAKQSLKIELEKVGFELWEPIKNKRIISLQC